MKYSKISDVKLGDRVTIEGGDSGTVVYSSAANQFSDRFPAEIWAQHGIGVMVETDGGALVFMDELVSSGGTPLVWPEDK